MSYTSSFEENVKSSGIITVLNSFRKHLTRGISMPEIQKKILQKSVSDDSSSMIGAMSFYLKDAGNQVDSSAYQLKKLFEEIRFDDASQKNQFTNYISSVLEGNSIDDDAKSFMIDKILEAIGILDNEISISMDKSVSTP